MRSPPLRSRVTSRIASRVTAVLLAALAALALGACDVQQSSPDEEGVPDGARGVAPVERMVAEPLVSPRALAVVDSTEGLPVLYVGDTLSWTRTSGPSAVARAVRTGVYAVQDTGVWCTIDRKTSRVSGAVIARDTSCYVILPRVVEPPADTVVVPPDTTPAPSDTTPTPTPTINYRFLIEPDSMALAVGQTGAFRVREIYQDGSSYTYPAGATGLGWASSNPGVAAVARSVVTATGAGSARVIVTKTVRGIADTAVVVVSAAQPPPTDTVPSDTTTPPPPPGPGPTPPPPPPPPTVDTTGMRLITDRQFHTYASATNDRVGAEGWDPIEARTAARAKVVVDPTAPADPTGHVLEILYPAGFTSGSAPMTAQKMGINAKVLYISMWIWIDPQFSGNFSSTNKVIHHWIAGGNRFFTSMEGQYMNPLEPQLRLQGTKILDTRPRLRPNVATGFKLQRGVWQRWDFLIASSTPGKFDGVLRWWIDGKLVSDYHDVGFLSTGESELWQQVQLSPTYGGGGPAVPHDMKLRIDRIIIRGK